MIPLFYPILTIIFCLILVLVLIYGIWEDRINRAVMGWMR